MIIGIRREDKNQWERRVPLIPDDVKYLKERYGIKTLVQPSEIRAYTNEEYSKAGAMVKEDINDARLIFAVKEIPINFYREEKTYVFFSHTIKGQSHNMPLLKKMIELRCNLIDYERIIDESNKRLLFFGKYAGMAGMIETLHSLGQKLKLKGFQTSFEKIKQPYQYSSIEKAKTALKDISKEISLNGIPEALQPIVFGFAGYGHVSQGAQEIFDLFPVKSLKPEELIKIKLLNEHDKKFKLFKVVFEEKDIVKPKEGSFVMQDYYDNPGNYIGIFEKYIPYLTVLVNCIVWSEKYPRLVTKKYLQNIWAKESDRKLLVIGDISCDINGAIEITNKATHPGNPTYNYLPEKDLYDDGTKANGITIMAIDNLPCEFPKNSSAEFSSTLKKYVGKIANTDFNNPFEELSLPYPIKKALILQSGELTKDYLYLNKYLSKV